MSLILPRLAACSFALYCFFPIAAHGVEVIVGSPTKLSSTINFGEDTSTDQMGPEISSDGLRLFFTTGPNYPIPFSADGSERDAQNQQSDIYVATRDSIGSSWNSPMLLSGSLNSAGEENSPSIASDGSELYFADGWSAAILHQMNRQNGESRRADLWFSSWNEQDASWDIPESLGTTVNSDAEDFAPNISADGRTLFFSSWRADGEGASDLWYTERLSIGGAWGEPQNLGSQVNTPFTEQDPEVSSDGLVLFFGSNALGEGGPLDLFVSTRDQIGDAWGPAAHLGPTINTPAFESAPTISMDGSTLYFIRSSPSDPGVNFDIWQAPVSYVPEPGAGVLFAIGVLFLLQRRRRGVDHSC